MALGGGQDSNVVRLQVAVPGDQDGNAGYLAVLDGSPHVPVTDRLRKAVIGPALPGFAGCTSGTRSASASLRPVRRIIVIAEAQEPPRRPVPPG